MKQLVPGLLYVRRSGVLKDEEQYVLIRPLIHSTDPA